MKASTVLGCFVAVALLQGAVCQSTTGCTQQGAWNSTNFSALIQQLNYEGNELVRQEILQNAVAVGVYRNIFLLQETAQGFTAKQTVLILQEFENEIIAEEVLVNISRWILALYSSDVALILNQWDNELTRLEVLPYLVNLTIDLR